MSDAINPDHYKRLPAEAIEIIESAIGKAPSNQDAYLHGQALKYLLRCWHKNGIEDLRKAKWYLDRLIGSFDENEQKQPDSDKIPDGYRKLKDSSIEPRQRGDLRWSVAEKRYIEIGFEEIGYANRDNWAACRKITGEAIGEVTVEVTGEVEPPDGWRWLEVGEVIRKGDKYRDLKSQTWIECVVSVGDTLQDFHKPTIRRNRFEVGEKVVAKDSHEIWEVDSLVNGVYQLRKDQTFFGSYPEHLAPYIEDAT